MGFKLATLFVGSSARVQTSGRNGADSGRKACGSARESYRAFQRGNLDGARRKFEQALTLGQEARGRILEARALIALAELNYARGLLEESITYYLGAIDVMSTSPRGMKVVARCHVGLGTAYKKMGDEEGASENYDLAIEVARKAEYYHLGVLIEARVLYGIAQDVEGLWDFEAAESYYQRSAEVFQEYRRNRHAARHLALANEWLEKIDSKLAKLER